MGEQQPRVLIGIRGPCEGCWKRALGEGERMFCVPGQRSASKPQLIIRAAIGQTESQDIAAIQTSQEGGCFRVKGAGCISGRDIDLDPEQQHVVSEFIQVRKQQLPINSWQNNSCELVFLVGMVERLNRIHSPRVR